MAHTDLHTEQDTVTTSFQQDTPFPYSQQLGAARMERLYKWASWSCARHMTDVRLPFVSDWSSMFQCSQTTLESMDWGRSHSRMLPHVTAWACMGVDTMWAESQWIDLWPTDRKQLLPRPNLTVRLGFILTAHIDCQYNSYERPMTCFLLLEMHAWRLWPCTNLIGYWSHDQQQITLQTWSFVPVALIRPFLTMECQFSMLEPLQRKEKSSYVWRTW